MLLFTTSQWHHTIDLLNHWLDIDPLNPVPYLYGGLARAFVGDLDAGRRDTLRARELGHLGSTANNLIIASSTADTDALRAGIEEAESTGALAPQALTLWKSFYYVAVGDESQARTIMEPFLEADAGLMAAWAWWVHDDLERALDAREKTLRDWRNWRLIMLARPFPSIGDKHLPSLEHGPEYQQRLKTIGLDDDSIAKLVVPPFPNR